MAHFAGRSLITCPEAYSKSLKIFDASLEPSDIVGNNLTLKCLKEHIVPLLSTSEEVDILKDPEDHSPFCILSIGSRDGCVDLPFIEMLSNACEEKTQFFERAIEPDKFSLESFRAKAEDLPESAKSKADIKFEWLPMTFQGYVEQKKSNDVQFHMVHFIHSIYYVDINAALKHCYEKELGPKGVIISITNHGDHPVARYRKEFSSQGLILNPGAHYSNKDVADVARKYGWKYVECPGHARVCDIKAIFDRSSVEGNLLLDFLTHRVNVRDTVGQENLQKILSYWEKECNVDDSGKKMVNSGVKAVMILKGM